MPERLALTRPVQDRSVEWWKRGACAVQWTVLPLTALNLCGVMSDPLSSTGQPSGRSCTFGLNLKRESARNSWLAEAVE
jgi:hypothetical protein